MEDQIKLLASKVDAQAKKFKTDFGALSSEIKQATQISNFIPDKIVSDSEETARKAQKAIKHIEIQLDRIVAVQHDCKVALQGIIKVENIIIAALVNAGIIAKNASGPTQQRVLISTVKNLMTVKSEWSTLLDLCQTAQSRLGIALKSLKFQLEMESNLRWAQHRPPN